MHWTSSGTYELQAWILLENFFGIDHLVHKNGSISEGSYVRAGCALSSSHKDSVKVRNIYIMFDGVNWAGFLYLLPAYPCSLSYCMICLGIGASPSSPAHCHSLLSYLFWTHWKLPWFLCEDAPLATTSVIGISHLNIILLLVPLLLPTCETRPPLPIPPYNSLQNSWYKTSK